MLIRKVRDSVPVRVLQAFGASQASNYASALAFNTLLAMFPLMLGILAIIGLSIRDPAAEASFQSLIVATFPATAQPELIRALHGVKDSAGLLAVMLIEVLSLVFPLYEHIAGGFNTYGAQFALFFVLAAWFYLLSNLVLLGAVYNKFRAGTPERLGLFASPRRESRELASPHEVIEKKKADVAA